jgi:nucleoside-diphosphate-sugar epimerase
MLPGLIAFLKSPSSSYLGSGANRLPCVYAGDVAELCILAATSDATLGEIYNAVNHEYVTQRDLFEAVAACTSLPAPKRSLPLRAVYALAMAMEARARLRGWEHRPDLTRFSVNLLGVDYVEDASKAVNQLGWKPQVSMREAVRRSVEWSRERRSQPVSG